MAKPPVVEDKHLEHMLKATAGYSRTPERDVVLLDEKFDGRVATKIQCRGEGEKLQRALARGPPRPVRRLPGGGLRGRLGDGLTPAGGRRG